MSVELPLTAVIGWSETAINLGGSDYDRVHLYLGETQIAELPVTAEPSRAGHGDDSSFFEAEERRIIEETIAPYLQRIFAPPIETT